MGIVPQLDQCCCGCQLRTGSKFVGWCGVTFGIIGIILSVLLVAGTSIAGQKPDSTVTPEQLEAMKIIFIFAALICLLLLVFSIILLVGIYQERVSYYLPWIIYSIVELILDLIVLIITISQIEQFANIAGTVIGMCIHCYFVLVVYSDYRQLKEGGQGGH